MSRAAEIVKFHEGTGPMKAGRFLAYRCPAGRITIGYGRNLEDFGMSLAEVENLLHGDIFDACQWWAGILPNWADLDEVRRAALIDMYHNLGATKLSRFLNTIGALSRGDWESASMGMIRSRWYQQHLAMSGLRNRVTRLAEMIRTGIWPRDVFTGGAG